MERKGEYYQMMKRRKREIRIGKGTREESLRWRKRDNKRKGVITEGGKEQR